jgi:hypothetical protein
VAGITWGINGHPFVSYGGVSLAGQVDLVKQMGLNSYRVDIYNSSQNSMKTLSTLIAEGKEKDVDILPVLALHPSDYKNESTAYQAGKAMASAYAKAFHGMTWELGNETDNFAIKGPSVSGASRSDYDDARYAIDRGLLKGMYDGIKQADPTSKAVIDNAGWHHYGFLQRLAADNVKWDITGQHWYSDQGSITNVGGGGVNALEMLKAFGKPIWITEVSARPGTLTNQTEGQWLTKTMADWNGLASKYNIQAAHIYELLDQPHLAPDPAAKYGVASPSGALKPAGTDVKNFFENGSAVLAASGAYDDAMDLGLLRSGSQTAEAAAAGEAPLVATTVAAIDDRDATPDAAHLITPLEHIGVSQFDMAYGHA